MSCVMLSATINLTLTQTEYTVCPLSVSIYVSVCVGVNVYSMLKHETLVLTVAAVERIEERLLSHIHNVEFRTVPFHIEKLQYF